MSLAAPAIAPTPIRRGGDPIAGGTNPVAAATGRALRATNTEPTPATRPKRRLNASQKAAAATKAAKPVALGPMTLNQSKAADGRAAKVVKNTEYESDVKSATSRREAFEAANPERFKGTSHLPGSVSPKHDYEAMGLGPAAQHGEQIMNQLPLHDHKPFGPEDLRPSGFEQHPGTVQNPTRWEDMDGKAQQRTLAAAARFGVTPQSAHHAFGAHVDQAALRDHAMGQQHQSFYTAMGTDKDGIRQPRQVLMDSAKENGVPFVQQAMANSLTSPKQQFVGMPKSGPRAGQNVYRNDEQATHAIKMAHTGTPVGDIHNPSGMPGFHNATRKAVSAVRAMDSGMSANDAWSKKGIGVNPGPKTGPFHNSWVDPHSGNSFIASDIHTGGGGFAPHLTIPEREAYLNIPGIHAFNNHVAHNVTSERGLNSVTGVQSMQWSEARRQRGLQDDHLQHDYAADRGLAHRPEATPAPAAAHETGWVAPSKGTALNTAQFKQLEPTTHEQGHLF